MPLVCDARSEDAVGRRTVLAGRRRRPGRPERLRELRIGREVLVRAGPRLGGGRALGRFLLVAGSAEQRSAEARADTALPSKTFAFEDLTLKGKGRAVYLDTEPYGGVTLELIYDPH